MTRASIAKTSLRLAAGCSVALLVAAGSVAAFAHGHHHGDNGGQKTVGIVPQRGSPPLTGGPDYVYRGKDGKLHHSSDGSIATGTTVRDHRNGKNWDCQENPNNPAGFCFNGL